MMGSMFAGLEESPGEFVITQGLDTRATEAWAAKGP
jgi:IMP dehydrogenase/GMP reductase